MDAREVLVQQLEQYYKEIRQKRRARYTIRNWCITIWVAVLIAIGTEKIITDETKAMILVFLPILMFWILEVFQQSFVVLDENRTEVLERILSQTEILFPLSIEYFYNAGYTRIPYKSKVRISMSIMFTSETIIIFYSIMLIGGVLFIYCF